jgi:dolichol-phosphate mannosyltransferase
MLQDTKISIVIPLFNEEGNLGKLYHELIGVLNETGKTFEIIFVDDGSSDRSFSLVKQLARQDAVVRGISFSRNFGHQVAIMAGLEASHGEVVVTMDGDLQHPPSLIPALLTEYEKGYDIVNTIRHDTAGAGIGKRLTSALFYSLMRRMSDVQIIAGAADFRLMNRMVVDAFIRLPERDRFTRGLVSWMGFRQTAITYSAAARFSGTTKYTFRKMMRFALDAITSFSPKPLRISFYLGVFSIITGLIYAIYAIYQHFTQATIPGWTSLLLVVLVLGGAQLLSLGIIGEYIARIYVQAKSRPLYFIRETI